ncbi:UPF0182 family protein [Candidatus Gracilibacteria bacterium]|nr:UPF0182 family protein [Candidatus Gracilibacteria bacterium]
MFGTIFFFVLLGSLIPLIIKSIKAIKIYSYNDNRYNRNEHKPYPSNWTSVIVLPIAVIISWILFSVYVNYATKFWWYQEVGRTDVFWTLLIPKIKIFFASFIILLVSFYLFTKLQYKSLFGNRWSLAINLPISFVVSLGFGLWIASEWQNILMYQNQSLMGLLDPLFNKDASYYLFSLNLYDDFLFIAKTLVICALLYSLIVFIVKAVREEMNFAEFMKTIPRSVWIFIALWCGIHLFDRQISIYQLMYSDHGLFSGVNYVGQNVDIPIFHTEQIVFALIGIIALCIPFFKKAEGLFKFLSIVTIIVMFGGLILPLFIATFNIVWLIIVLLIAIVISIYLFLWGRKMDREILVLVNILITIIFVQFIANEGIIPASIQAVYVSPKEKQVEAPYIKNNIEFTKQAFCLTDEYLVEKSIDYSEKLTKEMLISNQQTIDNIRILDHEATIQVLDNSQTETQYYHFNDVDVDRYPNTDGTSNMYFVGAREMNQDGLQSKTYYNTKYVYGHGYGYIKARGNTYDITSGYPILEVKGMPIRNGEPRVYYQEGDIPEFFYVNSNQNEIDYPVEKGEIEYAYTGKGGISINTAWKKFCFAKKYDWRLFFGGAPVNDSTKIMLNRNVSERVKKICPFITWSSDALFVIRPDGTAAWIVDGFSISEHFPYSSDFDPGKWGYSFGKFNYIRHSVKAVVDAFDGTVEFFTVNEKNDPIIGTIENIFPDMFKPLSEMPKDLQQHLIYPIFYFKAQSYMYLKYHMDDPYEFYQQDKIWRVANENYKGEKTMMEPRYMLLKLPNENKEKFVITIPFTPKELSENQTRDFLTGWVAGECDPENFLKLNVFMYPKGKEIFGPWMIENATNTESQISKSFTLWGQGGSNVWQGNLMLVPIDNTIIAIEPVIVLAQANDGKQQLPSIKMIIAFHNKHLAWGRTTEEALYNLLQGYKPQEAESFTGSVKSIYDQYEVTIPIIDKQGNVSSKTISASSQQEALKEMQKAILKFEEGLKILKGAMQTLSQK